MIFFDLIIFLTFTSVQFTLKLYVFMCGNGIFFLEEVWELRYTEFLNFAHVWERIQFLEEVWEQRSHAFPPTLTTGHHILLNGRMLLSFWGPGVCGWAQTFCGGARAHPAP